MSSQLPSFSTDPSPSTLPADIPGGVTAAWTAPAYTLSAPTYLHHLARRVRDLGGLFAPRVSIPPLQETGSLAMTLSQVFAIASETRTDGERGCAVFVNATGLGARDLVGDRHIYPARGQVHLVRGVAKQATAWHMDADGKGERSLRYVIPRVSEGTTIVGGCKEVGNWSPDIDQGLKKEILEGCKLLAPELCTGSDGGFEVLGDQVGLRPAREGGARVERELVEGFGAQRWIVHAYGNAGAGYQNSIGVAGDVRGLVDECCKELRKGTKSKL